MVRAIVARGTLAGAVAGLVAWLFALAFVEPLIELAIGYEDGRGEAEQALTLATGGQPALGGEEELVSRSIQSTLGIGVGMVLFGIAMGLLFAVVYAMAQGRFPVGPRGLAMLVATGGFVALYATPFLKYPASPPAVGNDETVGDRTGLYLIMVLGSVVLLALAVLAWQRLAPRVGGWNAGIVAATGYVVLAGVLMSLMPGLGELAANTANGAAVPTETPQPLRDPQGAIVFPGFDPDVLYWFRVYSVLAQALLWAVLGTVAGALIERRLDRSPTSAAPGSTGRETAAA